MLCCGMVMAALVLGLWRCLRATGKALLAVMLMGTPVLALSASSTAAGTSGMEIPGLHLLCGDL